MRDFFSGSLPGKVYEQAVTPVLVVLPALMFAPLRFLSDKTEYRKMNLVRDLMSSYVGLATFYSVRTAMGVALKKRGIVNPQLRFLMAVTAGVLSRTVFQAMGANKIAAKMAEKGWIPVVKPTAERINADVLMKLAKKHDAHLATSPSVKPNVQPPTPQYQVKTPTPAYPSLQPQLNPFRR